jgi:FkbM family methyltransferase
MKRQLNTIRGSTVEIQSELAATDEHFANGNNYADFIIGQMNVKNMYADILPKGNDLTILDIGANIGLFSLHVSDCAKAIYAIEPTPAHFEILMELTEAYSNIHPQHLALSGEDGDITLYISTENSTMNSIANRYGDQVTVSGKKLSSVLDMLGLDYVDFIKCDIEGSEMIAINDETIGEVKDRVGAWFIEAHATSTDNTHDNRNTLKEVFERAGYQTEYYEADGLRVFKS